MNNDAYLGQVTTKKGLVVWKMEPGEARDLADFMEENTSGDDVARHDIAALREAADEIEP